MKDLTLSRSEVDAFIAGLRLAIVQLENDKQIDYDLYMKLEKNIKNVVFDRGGYVYTGRVQALAEAAREAGLEF